MNAQRDAFGRVTGYSGTIVGEALDTVACQDCRADVRLVDVGDGVTVAQVLHDESCPWLGARTKGQR